MPQLLVALALFASLFLGGVSAQAQQPVKIGLINVLSGQFADAGIQLDNGIKTYIQQHGDTVAGKKIELFLTVIRFSESALDLEMIGATGELETLIAPFRRLLCQLL